MWALRRTKGTSPAASAAGSRDLVERVISFVQHHSGCDAVGIRLRDGDDFPYYETRGFPPEFVAAERYLCARDAAGDVVRDAAGDPVLSCMCGNVVRGRFDPAQPFFRAAGSFWSNGTSAPPRCAPKRG